MQPIIAEKPGKDCLAYTPAVPDNVKDLDIPLSLVEDLILRHLYIKGASCITKLSDSLKLSSPIIQTAFQQLRRQQLFEVTGLKGSDYTFTLSGLGREHAFNRFSICHYIGPAPVSVMSYFAAVRAQASKIDLNQSMLKNAFSDLILTDSFLDQLGPAFISQKSIFLYGPTGNGKTSVITRLSRIYRDAVLIPYAVEVDGQIIVLYDPAVHKRLETNISGLDPRWVACRRPCILAGGELEQKMLELQMEESTKVYAAPLQMRANNGMFIIDDFGRQLVKPRYLLNRWIVPLDRRVDFLTLRYGVKFQIPFEMIVVFSTNLDPSDLADEAFLRRIPNKIYVEPVQPQVFDQIFQRLVYMKDLPCEPDSAEFLRKLCFHYSGSKKLRACYPADILDIIASISMYEDLPAKVNKANLERAARLYFTEPANGVRKYS